MPSKRIKKEIAFGSSTNPVLQWLLERSPNYCTCFVLVSGLCSFVTLLLFMRESSSILEQHKPKHGDKIFSIAGWMTNLRAQSTNASKYLKSLESGSKFSSEAISQNMNYARNNDIPLNSENNKFTKQPPSHNNALLTLRASCEFTSSLNNQVGNSIKPSTSRDIFLTDYHIFRTSGKHPHKTFKQRLVHLDLKGAPPKVEYLEKLFPLLKQNGATGILLEYEDMFPFSGPLSVVKAKDSYCPDDIRRILQAADKSRLEVIPLIQTFGHLEFVLKFPQFIQLREVNTSSSALCPSNADAFSLVTDMIDQILSLHPKVKRLHIGCDEVFYMGLCNKCNKYQYQKDVLYLSHVTRVAKYVRQKYNIIPIIWDDMIRRTSSRILKQSRIGSLVEPMVWVYAEDVPALFFPRMWQRYRMTFRNVWAASAFKGAFGRAEPVPNVFRRLKNHISWLSILNSSDVMGINFHGIALTGWQRYEHFGPLCELLPVGLPSLILNLLIVSRGEFSKEIDETARRQLNCEKKRMTELDVDPYMSDLVGSCDFPGSEIFDLVHVFKHLNESLNEYIQRVCYYSKGNESSLWLTQMRDFSKLKECNWAIKHLIYSANHVMMKAFDELSTAEWIEQNLTFLFNVMNSLEVSLHNGAAFSHLCRNNYYHEQVYKRIFPIASDEMEMINQC